MLDECEGPKDWKKRQELVNNKLKGIAKKSDSKIADTISSRTDRKEDKSISINCELISTLCYEAQEQLRSGKMTTKEVIKDLCEALECIPDMKAEADEKSEE